MGRTIFYDAEVQANLDLIFQTKVEQPGLIIGQRTVQKDIVIRLCPVPPKEEEVQENAVSSSKESTSSAKKNLSNIPKPNTGSQLELDERWIAQYSKEVTRTLPGGFSVLGVYIAAPSDSGNKLHPKLRQVLFAVAEALSRDQQLSICSDVVENILLHISTDTVNYAPGFDFLDGTMVSITQKTKSLHRKNTNHLILAAFDSLMFRTCICRTYDVSNIKSTPNPAEWKFLSGAVKWHALKSQLAVDIKFAIKSEDRSLSVKNQIYSSLNPFFANVQNAVALLNNVLRDPEELLDSSSEGKKSKKQQQQQPMQDYCIDILFQLEPSKDIVRSLTSESIMMLTFKGNIQCRAFVHGKATVKEAVQAMKQDVIRSVTARCEIHCEDLLVIDEESQDPVVVYELPKRVFAPLPQTNLLVCDYQFHGDSAGDSLGAFKELLNLELNEQDIETSCEVSPATSALIQPEVMEDRLSEFGDNPAPKKSVFLPVASAAVAAMAAGLSYFLLLQDT